MYYPIVNTGITLSEIPGKTALFIEIGRCKQGCKGCHSPYLSNGYFTLMPLEDCLLLVKRELEEYPDINAILLMGGTNNEGVTLESLKKLIEEMYMDTGIPVGLYSGRPSENLKQLAEWFGLCWLKVGNYVEALGGLECKTTNQRLYEKDITYTLNSHKEVVVHHGWRDITNKFWKDR